MTRSLKKNPFVANHLLGKIEKLNMRAEKEIIVTWLPGFSLFTPHFWPLNRFFLMEKNICRFI
uniref:Ribosomal protein S19 n=1 Tax=Plagiorhegma dubium TaxID=168834 RepID=A0A344A0S3_9MAGN|nr:ribosomal protein S19 [Plagiorhegma dubium]AWT58333.1 ribosomal protein S19 [Plagiorhegma dubium]